MGIDNHFWPTSKRKVFKIGGKLYNCADSDFDPRPEIGYSGPVWGRISKKNLFSSCPGTCLVNDYKTNFFPHAHSGLHRPRKQKTAISGQIRSKATTPRHSCRGVEKILALPPGTSGQVGLLKLPIKWPYHNFIN